MMTPVDTSKVTRKELRSFGLILGGGLCLFFGLLLPWVWDFKIPAWPWFIGSIIALLGLLEPSVLKPFYVVWMKLGFVLGWINTRIILGIAFFIVLMPIGLLMRLLGNDPMHRKNESELKSYRVAATKNPVEHLEKPY